MRQIRKRAANCKTVGAAAGRAETGYALRSRARRLRMLAVVVGLVLGGFALANKPASAAAAPSIATQWIGTKLDLDECKKRAEAALREAGFDGVTVLASSVFAAQERYSAMVRCAPARGVVFFVVAGPEIEDANRHIAAIGGKF